VIDTTKGQVVVELYPSLAPQSVERILTLTRQHFYDGVIFHRVIEDFMAQTGDPQGTGMGGSELPNLQPEFTMRHDASFPFVTANRPAGSLIGFVGAMPVQSQVNELMAISNDGKTQAWGLFCQGALGLAHSYEPDSANSQFFIMRGANSSLEKKYTAFGVVVYGLSVVRKLKIGEPPVDPDKMTQVRVLADIPEAERPDIEIMDTASPQFQTVLDAVRKDKGENFSACDVTIPSKDLKVVAAPADTTPATVPAISTGATSPAPPEGK